MLGYPAVYVLRRRRGSRPVRRRGGPLAPLTLVRARSRPRPTVCDRGASDERGAVRRPDATRQPAVESVDRPGEKFYYYNSAGCRMPTTPELVIVAYTRSEVDRVAIQKATTGLLDAGLEPAGDGPRVEYAAKDGYTDSSDRDTALSSTAAAEIVDNGRGEVVFSLDDFEFQCSLIVAPDVVDVPSVHMSVPEPTVTAVSQPSRPRRRRSPSVQEHSCEPTGRRPHPGRR